MIYGTREDCLRVLRMVGRESCQYSGNWPENFCDCKYGVKGKPMFPKYSNDLQVRDISGEQCGCPELRSIYRVIENMSDEEWNDHAK